MITSFEIGVNGVYITATPRILIRVILIAHKLSPNAHLIIEMVIQNFRDQVETKKKLTSGNLGTIIFIKQTQNSIVLIMTLSGKTF